MLRLGKVLFWYPKKFYNYKNISFWRKVLHTRLQRYFTVSRKLGMLVFLVIFYFDKITRYSQCTQNIQYTPEISQNFKTIFLQNTSGRLLLEIILVCNLVFANNPSRRSNFLFLYIMSPKYLICVFLSLTLFYVIKKYATSSDGLKH